MKDRGCSRRTRAAGRRAGAPSVAVAMVGVKRKLRRARTRERQDSRAMRHTLSFAVIDMEPLQRLGFTRIAWRDHQGWRKCRPCTTARMQEVGRSTPAGMQAIERRRSQSRRARADESMDGRGRTTQEAKVEERLSALREICGLGHQIRHFDNVAILERPVCSRCLAQRKRLGLWNFQSAVCDQRKIMLGAGQHFVVVETVGV